MKPARASATPARRTNKARYTGRRERLVADAGKRRARKRQQRWITCIAAGLALCAITFFALIYIADAVISARPVWWAPADGSHARTIAAAERFERRVSDRMTMLRDDEERWTLTMTDEEAASWVVSRLPVWLEAEGVVWPMRGRPFDMRFTDEGSVLVGMPMTGKWQRRRERVVVAELELSVDELGGLVVHLEGVTLGRLPLPDSWARGHLQAAASRAALDPSTVNAVMTGDAALRQASLPIDRHRLVRVEAIDVGEGELTLTCVTTRRAHAQR